MTRAQEEKETRSTTIILIISGTRDRRPPAAESLGLLMVEEIVIFLMGIVSVVRETQPRQQQRVANRKIIEIPPQKTEQLGGAMPPPPQLGRAQKGTTATAPSGPILIVSSQDRNPRVGIPKVTTTLTRIIRTAPPQQQQQMHKDHPNRTSGPEKSRRNPGFPVLEAMSLNNLPKTEERRNASRIHRAILLAKRRTGPMRTTPSSKS